LAVVISNSCCFLVAKVAEGNVEDFVGLFIVASSVSRLTQNRLFAGCASNENYADMGDITVHRLLPHCFLPFFGTSLAFGYASAFLYPGTSDGECGSCPPVRAYQYVRTCGYCRASLPMWTGCCRRIIVLVIAFFDHRVLVFSSP